MWKLSKWLLIPIQIILFALLVTVVVKVFVTKDNADRLNAELEKSGIAEVEKAAVTGAVNALKKNKEGKAAANEAKPAAPQEANAAQSKPAPEAAKKQPSAEKSGETNFVDLL